MTYIGNNDIHTSISASWNENKLFQVLDSVTVAELGKSSLDLGKDEIEGLDSDGLDIVLSLIKGDGGDDDDTDVVFTKPPITPLLGNAVVKRFKQLYG